MIDTLHIKHFLCFENLEIPQLKRVNLIAGKNNVGKTALLEALRIYAADGDESVVNHILGSRGAFNPGRRRNYEFLFNRISLKTNQDSSLFTLAINDLVISRIVTSGKIYPSYRIDLRDEKHFMLEAQMPANQPYDKAIYIPFQSEFKKLAEFWENISLTDKEDDVNEIIRDSIESKLIRFDIGPSGVRVRLDGIDKPVPLSTLGDGVQRILLIALSLANAQDGFLLIDEIEAGLHYTVLEKLWKMVFKYAKAWNIQVFATTHSQDAIKAFHYVASQENYAKEAEFIRLQHGRKGPIEAVVYNGKQLENILDLDLEIR